VAVMGVDNDNVLCPLCDPPLSSIEPDTERLGAEAAALLARLMAGASAPTGITQVPPLRIAERASTDVVALDDPVMVQAVRFIRDHVGRGIAVKDVLAHVGRSRSDLEQRFRRWLGCSVRAEIVRRRLDHVAHLLTETDLSVNDVAARAGFATVQHFCRVFRRQFGRTPSEHRAACEVG
jgi:LacI family transcriptional regulator